MSNTNAAAQSSLGSYLVFVLAHLRQRSESEEQAWSGLPRRSCRHSRKTTGSFRALALVKGGRHPP